VEERDDDFQDDDYPGTGWRLEHRNDFIAGLQWQSLR
jgi:hypothetical protein